ncbi:MAG TPA: hypothetical protein VI911_11320 [Patescibacteria group bacterium]|nr:hypothetical protein [Patescibacteria group bacterium]
MIKVKTYNIKTLSKNYRWVWSELYFTILINILGKERLFTFKLYYWTKPSKISMEVAKRIDQAVRHFD